MKKWKKFAALGLAGIMVFSLSACGGGADTQEAAPAPAAALAPAVAAASPVPAAALVLVAAAVFAEDSYHSSDPHARYGRLR